MWKAKYYYSWFQERYIEDSSSEITLDDIFSKYKLEGGELQKIVIGRHILSLFPNVKTYQKWYPDIKRMGSVYKGFKEKNVEVEETFNDIGFILQSVPSPFFVYKNDDEEIQLAMFFELVNGNYLMKKISFNRNGEWKLHVGEDEINLEEFFVENHFRNTRTSVENVCSLVCKFHTCRGKEIQNLKTRKIPNYMNVIVEYLGVEKIKTCRSLRCKRLMQPIAISRTCFNCQRSIRFKTSVTEMPSKKLKLSDTGLSTSTTAESTSEENKNSILANSNDKDIRVKIEGYSEETFKTESSPNPIREGGRTNRNDKYLRVHVVQKKTKEQ